MRRLRHIIGAGRIALVMIVGVAGCGLRAEVKDSGNPASGKTTQQTSQPITTTQHATASSGTGPAMAETASATGAHSGQSGAVNIAWQPVAAAGGTGLASLLTWLAWSSRNQKRELEARTASEKMDFEADKVLIDAMSELASKAIDKRFP